MTGYLDGTTQDLRLAFRLMARRPGFTGAVLATLALGIGATTAIFSVVYGVLLRPLRYADPDRVVQFLMQIRTPTGPRTIDAVPVAEALQWRDSAATLSSLAVYNSRSLTLVTADGPQRLIGVTASPDFFEVLESAPMLGRTLAQSGGATDARVVVLSHATWRRYFGGDPAIVGRSVPFDGVDYRIAGVMGEDVA
ncbi:MAG TPA: ABC transporter permease, partial [Vicinamibacterales bacterium]|nr:ABC transporter permease [Vicinamibacterales bacterium]